MLFISIFVIYPALWTLYTSLTSYNLTIPFTHFVGSGNYTDLLGSSEFWSSVKRTFIVIGISLPIDIGIGMIAALVLNESFPGRGIVRVLLIVPWALPPIVNGFMWGWILNGDYGALNGLFYQLHLIPGYVHWLANPNAQLFWVSVVQAWTHYPFSLLLILAGLQSIPDDLYDAAKIDGAGPLRSFTGITFPLLRPSFLVAVVVGFISAFQIFDIIWSLTAGSSAATAVNPFTETLMVYNYATVFRDLAIGTGSALAYLILLISLGAGFAFMRVLSVKEQL
jgi:ABC-type sugar transport system permease subunit